LTVYHSLSLATKIIFNHYFNISGYLKANATYGTIPKVMLATAVGYFAANLSYQRVCMQKFMQLPNSPIGEHMRWKKGQLGLQERSEVNAFIFFVKNS